MLHGFLQSSFKSGDLTVRYPDGTVRRYGDATGPEMSVRLTARAIRRIAASLSLGLGESYMDGDLSFERGDIFELLDLAGRNLGLRPPPGRRPFAQAITWTARRLQELNDRARARRNVHHHYDLSHDLYRRFLDEDLQYSCAYFARPDMSLEEAQRAACRHRTHPIVPLGVLLPSRLIEMRGSAKCAR